MLWCVTFPSSTRWGQVSVDISCLRWCSRVSDAAHFITLILYFCSAGDNVLNLLLDRPKKIGSLSYIAKYFIV